VLPLEGRLAVVTGASRGIGLAIARALDGAGATVVRLARSLTDGPSGRFRDVRCDLGRVPDVVRATTRVLGEWGTPSLVVNAAGVFLLKGFEVTEPAELDRQLAVNLRGPFVLAQQFLPALRASGAGMIITVGSVADHVAYPENSAYAASKYGLRALHETLVAEYRGSGLRFTLISPGPTDTAIWDPVDPDARPGLLRRAQMLRPEDVAESVLFAATRPSHSAVEWLRLMPAPADSRP
jgi:NAD(P)-dependent dehydrogenase (short-subunit alcohol dehydrogenase family)